MSLSYGLIKACNNIKCSPTTGDCKAYCSSDDTGSNNQPHSSQHPSCVTNADGSVTCHSTLETFMRSLSFSIEGLIAIAIASFVIELVILIYGLMVVYSCIESTGLAILIGLGVFFFPFPIGLIVCIWGLASGCRKKSKESPAKTAKFTTASTA